MTGMIPNFRVHQETLDQLKTEAERVGLTVPAYIRMVLMLHLENK